MRILQEHDTGDMDMKRSEFLKMCAAVLAGIMGLGGLKAFRPAALKEARFYRSADTLLG